MIPLSIIKEAFPNQPRMQQAFAATLQQADDLVTQLSGVAEALASNGGDITAALASLDKKQPLNSILTEIGALPTDPGVVEQVQPGSWQIRPIDATDTRSLLTRQEADTRYLGGLHAAASATKLATARTIAATGDAAWSVTFDGSGNVTSPLTLATVNATTGTFGSATQSLTITVNAKGLITNIAAQTITPAFSSITGKPTTLAGYGITDAQGLNANLTSLSAITLAGNALKVIRINAGETGLEVATVSSPTGAALTKTDDTNVTLTLGGSPATALLNAASITVGWTGILAASRGGTANGFTAFSGPATSTKTFTLPNASDTIGCLGQAQSWTAKNTFTGSGDDQISLIGSGTGRSGIYVKASNSAGNATFYFENDRGGFASYGGVLTGGSTNANSFFGLTRADKTFLIHDGASGLGLGVGTLNAQPIVFGTNNTERLRISSTGAITATGTIAASNLSGTNTGDQTSVSGNAGTATQLATPRIISITGKATAAGGTFDGTGNLAINVTAMTLVAGDIPNIAESQVTNLTTDLAAKAPLESPEFTGVAYYQQPTPTAKTTTGTLTIADLLTLIITVTSTVAVTLTLPTGTLTDAGILSGTLATNEAFEWYIINLGSSSGAVTLAAGTGHTIVGSATVAISTSARFLTRKTAANTFVTYRIA